MPEFHCTERGLFMKFFETPKRRIQFVCALLFLVLFILQFVPYWSWTNAENAEKATSISGLIWMSSQNAELKTQLGLNATNFTMMNGIVLVPILTEVLSLVGFFFCLLKKESVKLDVMCIVFGAVLAVGYLVTPVLRAGMMWPHLLVEAAIVGLGVYGLILGAKEK